MDSSTAQSIAAGSQDFAALAGLFCTDGVERNLLATQYGYGSVAVSSMSILGLLGLVKSTMKVALGLDKCTYRKKLTCYLENFQDSKSTKEAISSNFG